MGKLDQPMSQVGGGGRAIETDDACEHIRFSNAELALDPTATRTGSRESWALIQSLCPSETLSAPLDRDQILNNANEAAPGDEGDSGVAQGVGGNDVGSDLDSPTTPPTPPPSSEEEDQRPPDGEPHPTHSDEEPQDQTDAADPVDIFNGALYLNETDLEIPNTILPLGLTRFYRSGASSYGPFGWNWDHNHNLFVRELKTGDIALWRNLHEDIFKFDGANFEPPRGKFEKLERVTGLSQTFEIKGPGGTTMRFERPAGWIDGERVPIIWAQDRYGNKLSYSYGSDDKLLAVTDDNKRYIRFEYNECSSIVSIEDHSGRKYRYSHDDQTQHLKCVHSPTTTDHPEGITRVYHYEQPFKYPELRHNILRIEDSEGNVYLENKYEQDPASWHYARLTKQMYGNCLFQFRYTQLQSVPADPIYINIPAVSVEVMNPGFGLETYTFNYRGDLIDRRFRLNKDKSFRIVIWQYDFDEQGNLSVITKPDGSREIITYDFGNTDPRMRRNMLQRELTSAIGFPSPSRIVWRAKYEATYQLITEEKNELSSLTEYKYDFNINPGSSTNTGKLLELHHPDVTLPDGTIQSGISKFEYNSKGQLTARIQPDGIRHEIAYGSTGNNAGRVSKQVNDVTGMAIEFGTKYDVFGFGIKSTDGNGNLTINTTNALGLLEKITLPAINGNVAEYHLHYNSDNKVSSYERPKGTYTDGTLAGSHIIDKFERNVLGFPTKYILSSNTDEAKELEICSDFRGFPLVTTNPDGSRIKRVYDERGLLISEEVISLDGTKLTSKRVYDRSGKLIQDTNSTGQTTKYAYEGFSRIVKMTLSNDTQIKYNWMKGDLLGSEKAIGEDDLGIIRQLAFKSYAYDERGRKISDTIKSFEADPTVSVDVTTTYFHDQLGRIEKIIDHRSGVKTIHYDGIGRVTKVIDPLGNEEHFDYDNNGNVFQVENHHIEPDGTTSIITKSFTYDERDRIVEMIEPDGAKLVLEYDDRNLQVSRSDYLGIILQTKYDSFNNKVEETHDVGGLNITHKWILDNMSRLTSYIDPTGQVSSYQMDGVGRITKTDYPNGFSSTKTFDDKGQVIEETLSSGVKFEFTYDSSNRLINIKNTGAPSSVTGVQPHEFAYDGLDRLVLAKIGTNKVDRKYDSLSRLLLEKTHGDDVTCHYNDNAGTIEKILPDGRTEEYSHDLNGVLLEIKETVGGTLGNGTSPIASFKPSGSNYFGEASYQGGTNIINQYDERKRLVETMINSPAGLNKNLKYRYDTANRKQVEAIVGQNPKLSFYDFDKKYRLTEAKNGFASVISNAITQAEHDAAITAIKTASAGASHEEGFEYNHSDARVKYTESGVPDKNYSYSPGYRIQTDGTNIYTHHTDGSLQNDSVLTYEIDALGRIIEIKSGINIVCKIEYDALGRPSIVKEQGKPILSLNYLGGIVEQEKENGIASKQITSHPITGVPISHHILSDTYNTLFDNRFNLIGLSDSGGNLIESYRYKSFGEPEIYDGAGVKILTSSFGLEPVFGGQRYLSSVGLYLSKRRLMNPVNGIYLSTDPKGYADSPSLYVYVAQNPIDLIDPEGELAFLAGLAIAALVGALVSGGLNATRQHIAIAEGSQEEWEWGQFGISTGIGVVAGPLLVVAPELAVPLAIYGVRNGVAGIAEGNYATGTFDIVTSLAPFGFKGVRGATFGRGSRIGQMRGLGPSYSWNARLGRFTLIGNAAGNFVPSIFGRRIGIGFSRSVRPGQTAEGHAAAVVENPDSTFTFFEKNAMRLQDRSLVAAYKMEQGLPEFYGPDPRFGPRPFEYSVQRISSRNASRASEYANTRMRQNGVEPFDFDCANCSHFAADVLGQAGFRNFGNGRGSGVYNNFVNFGIARSMSYLGSILANGIHPNETVESK